MAEYYVWDTEAQAQAALDYINNSGWFPIVGINALSKEPCPEKQQTTCWADAAQERTDGKWCFPRIPTIRLNRMGVTPEQRQAFLDTFNPSIEEYQDGWFPVEE